MYNLKWLRYCENIKKNRFIGKIKEMWINVMYFCDWILILEIIIYWFILIVDYKEEFRKLDLFFIKMREEVIKDVMEFV